MPYRFLVAFFSLIPGLAVADIVFDLQKALDEHRESQQVPGISAVVIRGSEVVYSGASGVADLESGVAMTADTPAYIGSVTKVLTAVLALQLVESERLSLDDVVDSIGSASDSPVRVSHLLTHASGLNRDGRFEYWFSATFPDSADLQRYLSAAPLRFAPGNGLHYSNVGYGALGQAIEQASGQSYDEALAERVLTPLGMTSSGTRGPIAGMANAYTPPGRLLPSEAQPFAGVGRAIEGRHERVYHDARAMAPAFGAYSSANDLGRLAMFLLGDGQSDVLSQAMRTRMFARQPSGWGLGLKLRRRNGRPIARHDGWFAAYRAHLILDVDGGVAVVVLANSDSGSATRIASSLYDVVTRRAPSALE